MVKTRVQRGSQKLACCCRSAVHSKFTYKVADTRRQTKWKMQYDYEQLSEQKFRARVVLMRSEKEQEELSWSQASGSEQKAKHAAAEIGLMTLAVCSQLRT